MTWADDISGLKAQVLLDNMDEILLACGIPTGQYNVDSVLAGKLFYTEDVSIWASNKQLRIPLYEIADPEIGYTEAGFTILAVPDRNGGNKALLKGIAIAPYLEGEVNLKFSITEHMELIVDGDVKTGIAIIVLPNKVEFEPDIYGDRYL